jgi:hypothetical protein
MVLQHGRFLRIILMKDLNNNGYNNNGYNNNGYNNNGNDLKQYQDFLGRWCKKTGLNANELVAFYYINIIWGR